MVISAKDFASRNGLDTYVKNNIGDAIEVNRTAGHTIEGTVDELKTLGLDASVTVYGVKVVVK